MQLNKIYMVKSFISDISGFKNDIFMTNELSLPYGKRIGFKLNYPDGSIGYASFDFTLNNLDYCGIYRTFQTILTL